MSRIDREPKSRIQIREASLEEIKTFRNRLEQEFGKVANEIDLPHLNDVLIQGELIAFQAIDIATQKIVGIIAAEKVDKSTAKGIILISDPSLPELQIGAKLMNYVKSACSKITLVITSHPGKYSSGKIIKYYESLGFKITERLGDPSLEVPETAVMEWRRE